MSPTTSNPWNNDELWFDLLICVALGGGFQVAAHQNFLGFAEGVNQQKAALYSVEAQVAASLLGFLLAAVAIITTSSTLAVVKAANPPVYRKVVVSFRDSMTSAVFAVAYCFMAWILDRSGDNAVWFVVGLAIMALLAIRIVRVIYRLQQILFI
jgi:hypothetical protein